MGAIQVPFYNKHWPTSLISIESYHQVIYFIEIVPRRIINISIGQILKFLQFFNIHKPMYKSRGTLWASCSRPSDTCPRWQPVLHVRAADNTGWSTVLKTANSWGLVGPCWHLEMPLKSLCYEVLVIYVVICHFDTICGVQRIPSFLLLFWIVQYCIPGICHSFLLPSLFFSRTNNVFFTPSVPILGANPLETLRPSLNTAGYSAADRMNPMPSRRKAEAFPAPLIVQDSTAHSTPCAPCAPCGMHWEGWV